MNEPNRAQLAFTTKYEIRIRGYLDQSWSDRLGGLTITQMEDQSGCEITTLRGQLPDQAAVFGVLNALYDMRLPLLYFECLDTG